MSVQFIKPSAVRKFLKERGRRCGKDFLHHLDRYLYEKLEEAARQHNGGRKTVDSGVANFIGLRLKA